LAAGRIRGAFAALLVAVGLLSAAPVRAAAPETEIRALLQAQSAAWNRGDLEGFMDAYERSDTLRFASGGNITYGWKGTLERYQQHYPDRATMGTLSFQIIDVAVLGADAAVVFGHWELARAKDRPSGLFTLVLRRTPAGWRITADHTSSAEK